MKPSTEILRDTLAKSAAIRQYAAAYDHHATLEQQLVAEGRYVEAEGAHEYALWVLRGYRAEIDNPKERA
jgi:hypothetical protein